MTPLQRLLTRLSVAVFGLGAGGNALAENTTTIDEAAVAAALESPEIDGWGSHDRARLLQLVAEDLRPSVRAEVARRIAELEPPVPRAALRLLARLAGDPAAEVSQAAAHALAITISRAPGLEGTSLVSKWAVSGTNGMRLAVAVALERPFQVLGGDTAIEHLAGDPVPAIRRAAARAAWARRTTAPDRFTAVLQRLSGDPDSQVREIANLALARS
jgi:hypothetical protein